MIDYSNAAGKIKATESREVTATVPVVLKVPAAGSLCGLLNVAESLRSQLLFKSAGAENMSTLAVNVLAVEFWMIKWVVPVYLRVN